MTPLRIVFAGTPPFGLPCLEALYASKHTLLGIYTQPDRPAGRGRKMQASAIKAWAIAQDLPIYQPLHFKEQDAVNELAALNPDVLVVIAYGLILPPKILSIPRLGCVNVHASLLPRWRGASPIQHAILYGDQQTGITIMQMDAGMDTGNRLASIACEISIHDTAQTLHDRLSQLAVAPLLQTLDELATQQAHSKPQDNNLATYAPKIKKEDARINWHQPATAIDQAIRAFYPWPIAYTELNDLIIRVHQAQRVYNQSTAAPGTILAMDKQGLLVRAQQDAILIEKIQFPGGKTITIADYLNAKHQPLGVQMVLGVGG